MIAGRYRLDREVGRGGMGAVWLAEDEILGRRVAAKRIGMAPGGGRPDLERAEREARIAASLSHPHVVAVYDLVTDDEQQWLVMEYVEGRSLADLLRAEGPLDPARAAAILAQVADALAAAHGAGIVHRDVKPSNILVSPDDHAKLTDFGIARAKADVTLTQTGMVTGSPAYLAPEIASGASASPTGDVWSVGATMLHALTGHPPYDNGENVVGTLYQIVHEEPPRLPTTHPYADVVAATLVKDPDQRWSMEHVRQRLAGDLAGLPPVPAPPTVDPHATQAMTAVQPVQPTAPTPAPEPRPYPPAVPAVLPGAPAPAPVPATTRPTSAGDGGERGPRSRRRALGALVAALLILTVVLAVVLWPEDDVDDGGEPAAQPTPSASATPETPSATPTTTDPEAGRAAQAETERQLRDFVASYVSEATGDRRAAFARLTPGFQQASGGFPGYDGFWSTIESARVNRVRADAETLQVSYRVRYETTAGRRFTDEVTLQLLRNDDSYLIDGEA